MFRLNCHYQEADTILLKLTGIKELIELTIIKYTDYPFKAYCLLDAPPV
jgi:hypothetical protein